MPSSPAPFSGFAGAVIVGMPSGPMSNRLSNTTAPGTGLPSGRWTRRTLTVPALPVGGGEPAGSKW